MGSCKGGYLVLFRYLAVVILANSIIVLAFNELYGKMLYPWWLWDIFVSFYWLTAVFGSLNHNYLDTTKPRTFIWDLKPLIAWLFCIHWVVAYVTSLAILAPLGVPWWLRWIIAYPGTYVFTVAIPMQIAVIVYPRYQKKQIEERIDPGEIRALAMQCDEASEFVKQFPDSKAFVVDNAFKNKVATCLFLHRKTRPEMEGLWEDAVLEIPVDMTRYEPLREKIKAQRYIFQIAEGQSAVYHLPIDDFINRHVDSQRLDDDTLAKFDSSLFRYPSLETTPFSLAIRDVPFEAV